MVDLEFEEEEEEEEEEVSELLLLERLPEVESSSSLQLPSE